MSTSDDNDAAYSDDDLAIDDTAPSAMEWTATNAPSSDNSAPTTTPESTAADSDDTANDECAICYEPRQHCLLRPCGHSICTTCVARLIVCPMCRATIESTDPHVARDTYCLRNAARRFQEEQDMHELREAAAHRVPTRPYSGRSDGELSMNRGRRGRHRRTRRRALRRHRRRRQHHRRRQHRHHRGRANA